MDIELNTHTVGDLVASKTTNQALVCATEDQTVDQVTKLLADSKLTCVAIQNANKDIVGVVDNFDILRFVVELYRKTTSGHWDPKLFGHWITTKVWGAEDILEERSEAFFTTKISSLLGVGGFQTWFVDSDATLSQLLGAFAGGNHRALVTNKATNTISIVSQSDFVDYLNKHKQTFSFGDKSLLELGLGTEKLPITINNSELAISAFYYIDHYKISAIPILNEIGQIQAQISVNDLRGLHAENFPALLLKATEYLDIYSSPLQPIGLSPNATFTQLMECFYTAKSTGTPIHRVWILDGNQEVLGLVSLTDVMKLLDANWNKAS